MTNAPWDKGIGRPLELVTHSIHILGSRRSRSRRRSTRSRMSKRGWRSKISRRSRWNRRSRVCLIKPQLH